MKPSLIPGCMPSSLALALLGINSPVVIVLAVSVVVGLLMVLLFAGLAQTGTLPSRAGYAIAIALAVVTFALAIVRYRRSK